MQIFNHFRTISAISGIRIGVAPGRIRVDAPDLFRDRAGTCIARIIAHALRARAVQGVLVDRNRGFVTIDYDRREWGIADALAGIASSLGGGAGCMNGEGRRHGSDCELREPDVGKIEDFSIDVESEDHTESAPNRVTALAEARGSSSISASGLSRAVNLVAAGGCFSLTIVALVVPGIPSVPFCLATSYFLVRSSPSLNERLRRSPLLGQVVRDYEDHGGLHATTKSWAVALAIGTAGATLLLTGPSLPVVASTAAIGLLDLWLVLRLPTVHNEPRRRALIPCV